MQNLTVWLNQLVKIATAMSAVLYFATTNAQQLTYLTLENAYQLAQKNYPLVKQKDLITQVANLAIQNISTKFFPQVSFSGQASYQSEVTKIEVPVAGFKIEPLAKDQYKALAEVSQLVYDGGGVKQQKEMQQLNALVEQQKVQVELYKLKERVNQLYLGALYLDEQLKQVALIKNDITTGINRVEAQVKNGIAFKSNASLLRAELLKANQRMIEFSASRKAMIQSLSLFLNTALSREVVLEKPLYDFSYVFKEIARPELTLFADQKKLLAHQIKKIQSDNQPKASLFLQGGYGRPTLNLLKNEFGFYYLGGIRLNWNLGGLYTRKNDYQLVNINKKTVDIQQEIFLLNIKTQLQQQQLEIDKLIQLIEGDDEIIKLREQVKVASRAQLENGVITASDYLEEINAEDQARQSLITHQIQLLQAQIDYKTTSGKQ